MMSILNAKNICKSIGEIDAGDLIVIRREYDNKEYCVKVKSIVNGNEIVFSGRNDYFNFDMYRDGTGWVTGVWLLGKVEITSITNNMITFPR